MFGYLRPAFFARAFAAAFWLAVSGLDFDLGFFFSQIGLLATLRRLLLRTGGHLRPGLRRGLHTGLSVRVLLACDVRHYRAFLRLVRFVSSVHFFAICGLFAHIQRRCFSDLNGILSSVWENGHTVAHNCSYLLNHIFRNINPDKFIKIQTAQRLSFNVSVPIYPVHIPNRNSFQRRI